MPSPIVAITGTDTAVGKTLLTALLARHLMNQKQRVGVIKPICSGGRGDAVLLRQAIRESQPLDEINPHHFEAPLAAVIAARREGVTLQLDPVLKHVRKVAAGYDVTLLEGAGGLLSPLGEGFSTLELIIRLGARPIVVAPNRLGVIGQVALVLHALPRLARARAAVVLMASDRLDPSLPDNSALIEEFTGVDPVEFPRVSVTTADDLDTVLKRKPVQSAIHRILEQVI